MPLDPHEYYLMQRRRQARYSYDVYRYQQQQIAKQIAAQEAARQAQARFELSAQEETRVRNLREIKEKYGATYLGIQAGLEGQKLEAEFRLKHIRGAPDTALFYTSEGEKITRDTAVRRLSEQHTDLLKEISNVEKFKSEGYKVRQTAAGKIEFYKTGKQLETEAISKKARELEQFYEKNKLAGLAHFTTTGILSWEDPFGLVSAYHAVAGNKREVMRTKAKASIDLDTAIQQGAPVYALKAFTGPFATVGFSYAIGAGAHAAAGKVTELTGKAALSYATQTGVKAALARASPYIFKGAMVSGGAVMGGLAAKDLYETYKRDPVLAGAKGITFLGALYSGIKGWKSLEGTKWSIKSRGQAAKDWYYKQHPEGKYELQLYKYKSGVEVTGREPGRLRQFGETVRQKAGAFKERVTGRAVKMSKGQRDFIKEFMKRPGDFEVKMSGEVRDIKAMSAREAFMRTFKGKTYDFETGKYISKGPPGKIAPKGEVWTPDALKGRVSYYKKLPKYYYEKLVGKLRGDTKSPSFGKGKAYDFVDIISKQTGEKVTVPRKGLNWGRASLEFVTEGGVEKAKLSRFGFREYKPGKEIGVATRKHLENTGAHLTFKERLTKNIKGFRLSGDKAKGLSVELKPGQLGKPEYSVFDFNLVKDKAKVRPILEFFKSKVVKGRTTPLKTKGGKRIFDFGYIELTKYSKPGKAAGGLLGPEDIPLGSVPPESPIKIPLFKGKVWDPAADFGRGKWITPSSDPGVSIVRGQPGAVSAFAPTDKAMSSVLKEATKAPLFFDFVQPGGVAAATALVSLPPGVPLVFKGGGSVGGVHEIVGRADLYKGDTVKFKLERDFRKPVEERVGVGQQLKQIGRLEPSRNVRAVPEVLLGFDFGELKDFKTRHFEGLMPVGIQEKYVYHVIGAQPLTSGHGLKPDFDRLQRQRWDYGQDVVFDVDTAQARRRGLKHLVGSAQDYEFMRAYGTLPGEVTFDIPEYPGGGPPPYELDLWGKETDDLTGIFAFGRHRKHPLKNINVVAEEMLTGKVLKTRKVGGRKVVKHRKK